MSLSTTPRGMSTSGHVSFPSSTPRISSGVTGVERGGGGGLRTNTSTTGGRGSGWNSYNGAATGGGVNFAKCPTLKLEPKEHRAAYQAWAELVEARPLPPLWHLQPSNSLFTSNVTEDEDLQALLVSLHIPLPNTAKKLVHWYFNEELGGRMSYLQFVDLLERLKYLYALWREKLTQCTLGDDLLQAFESLGGQPDAQGAADGPMLAELLMNDFGLNIEDSRVAVESKRRSTLSSSSAQQIQVPLSPFVPLGREGTFDWDATPGGEEYPSNSSALLGSPTSSGTPQHHHHFSVDFNTFLSLIVANGDSTTGSSVGALQPQESGGSRMSGQQPVPPQVPTRGSRPSGSSAQASFPNLRGDFEAEKKSTTTGKKKKTMIADCPNRQKLQSVVFSAEVDVDVPLSMVEQELLMERENFSSPSTRRQTTRAPVGVIPYSYSYRRTTRKATMLTAGGNSPGGLQSPGLEERSQFTATPRLVHQQQSSSPPSVATPSLDGRRSDPHFSPLPRRATSAARDSTTGFRRGTSSATEEEEKPHAHRRKGTTGSAATLTPPLKGRSSSAFSSSSSPAKRGSGTSTMHQQRRTTKTRRSSSSGKGSSSISSKKQAEEDEPREPEPSIALNNPALQTADYQWRVRKYAKNVIQFR